jgi:hypothetical protein
MSRLDSVIRRLMAQRSCLDAAMAAIAGRPGIVLELGLGNGRTYDHLRAGLDSREIYVFEREVRAHPDCIPDAEHLILGDLFETLPGAKARLAASAMLVHADIGTGVGDYNRKIAAFLGEHLPALLAPGALVVADRKLVIAGTDPEPLPADVPPNRYFMYRNGG